MGGRQESCFKQYFFPNNEHLSAHYSYLQVILARQHSSKRVTPGSNAICERSTLEFQKVLLRAAWSRSGAPQSSGVLRGDRWTDGRASEQRCARATDGRMDTPQSNGVLGRRMDGWTRLRATVCSGDRWTDGRASEQRCALGTDEAPQSSGVLWGQMRRPRAAVYSGDR